jgi:hypothetical protein
MGFLSGSVSHRRFFIEGGDSPAPEKAIEAIQEQLARNINEIDEEDAAGWSHRHTS